LQQVLITATDLVVLETLGWRWVECVIHYKRDVCEE